MGSGQAVLGRLAGGGDAVSAGVLGRVEGGVGAVDELVGGLAAVPLGHAGRAGLVGGGRLAEALEDREGRVGGAVGQEDGELLAAVAGEDVGRSEDGAPGSGGLLEQAVAGLVAAGVVEGLEVVEVE